MNFDLTPYLSKASEVLNFIDQLSPAIPGYGTIISAVAKGGEAIIALEPSAVQAFDQLKTTVEGGTPPTDAQLAEFAAETDAEGEKLRAHIAQLRAAASGS